MKQSRAIPLLLLATSLVFSSCQSSSSRSELSVSDSSFSSSQTSASSSSDASLSSSSIISSSSSEVSSSISSPSSEIIYYTLTFVLNNGNADVVEQLEAGAPLIFPTDLVKLGHEFLGWYLDVTLLQPNTLPMMPSHDVTLYASWQVNEYSITFITNSDLLISNMYFDFDQLITSLPTPSKLGHSFSSWYLDEALTLLFEYEKMPAFNLVLYAAYTLNSYTLIFNSAGGSSVSNITQLYGTSVFAPHEPTKRGYEFDGWYTNETYDNLYEFNTMPAQDLTLFAKWTPIVYTITYILYGGINPFANPYSYTIEDGLLPLANPWKTGHTFMGFYESSDFIGQPIDEIDSSRCEDITLYAKFDLNQYDITFHSLDGSPIETISVYYGDIITLPENPTRDGYAFVSWYLDGALSLPFTLTVMPDYDIDLYAKWTRYDYAITYYLYEGTNGANPISYNVDSPTITLQNPTKVGHEFLGWFLSNDYLESEQITQIMAGSTGNIELHAKWRVFTYDIKFLIPIDEPELLSSGFYFTVVSTMSGRVFAFGQGTYNQIPGQTTSTHIPVELTSLFGFSEGEKLAQLHSKGEHSLAITTSGRVIAFGSNSSGRLGMNPGTSPSGLYDITSRFDLTMDDEIVKVRAGGSFSYALSKFGVVYTWGATTAGFLGRDGSQPYHKPTSINPAFDLLSDEVIIDMDAGTYFGMAISNLGRVFSWGWNTNGQLATGTTGEYALTPVDVTANFDFQLGEPATNVYLGSHFYYLKTTSRLFSGGQNGQGMLATGGLDQENFPADVTSSFENIGISNIVDIQLGGTFAMFLTQLGDLYGVGYNANRITTSENVSRVLTPTLNNHRFALHQDDTIKQVVAGNNHVIIFTNYGQVRAWGNNQHGQLGVPSNINNILVHNIGEQLQLYDVQQNTFNHGQEFTLPTFDLRGHTLVGWYRQNDYNQAITGSITALSTQTYIALLSKTPS